MLLRPEPSALGLRMSHSFITFAAHGASHTHQGTHRTGHRRIHLRQEHDNSWEWQHDLSTWYVLASAMPQLAGSERRLCHPHLRAPTAQRRGAVLQRLAHAVMQYAAAPCATHPRLCARQLALGEAASALVPLVKTSSSPTATTSRRSLRAGNTTACAPPCAGECVVAA